MKKILSLLLVVSLLLTMVPAVLAAEGPTISMGDGAVDVKDGAATVQIPVEIKNNPGFGGMDISIPIPEGWSITKIDARTRTDYSIFFVEDEYGDMSPLTTPQVNPNKGGVGAFTVAYGNANITVDGYICWVTYSVPADAVNGDYSVAIGMNHINNFDATGVNISGEFTVVPGTITVTGGVDKLNDSNTTFEGLDASYVYDDGKAIEPPFTVKYGDKTLRKDTDYTVSYENNTAVGTATVTVTGTGSYKGSASTTFEIVKKTGKISGTASYSKAYGDAAFTLDAVANSGAAISYSSDNGAVATVDAAGKVTVVGSGSAVITASAAETENYTKPVDFKVNVTVGKAGQTLTGETSYTKTYGEDAFELNIGGAQGGLTYSSSKPSVASVDGNGKVTVAGVGTTTITVTAAEVAGKYNAATMSVTVTVEQKEVSVSGITVADKVYDKTTAATVTSKGTINGMVEGDDLDINVTGTFANANAGENKNVNLTVSLTGTDAANYKLAADSQTSATATIEKAPVEVPTAKTGLVYNTKAQTGVETTADYNVTGGSATNADDYIATVTLKDTTNYKWEDASFDGTVAWSIAKADAEDLTVEKSLRYSTTAPQTITISEIAQKFNSPGNVKFDVVRVWPNSILTNVEDESDTITYALKEGLTSADAGKTATLETYVESDNYNTVKLTITITVQDKIDVSEDIVFADGNTTYTGKIQKHETATYNGSADGITYSYSEDPVNVGTYKVTATYEDADNYGKKTVDFRVNAATVTVTGGKVETKEYNSNTDATIESVSFSGLVNGERFSEDDYTVTSATYTENANAGTGKKVSFTVELNDTDIASNYVLTVTAPTITGAIDPKAITVSLEDIADQNFSGNAITPAVTVTAEGTLNEYVLANGTDYTVAYDNNTNVGTASVTVEAKSGSNYTFADAGTTFEIIEAAAPEIADLAGEYTYNYTGEETLAIVGIPVNAGDVSYEIGTLTGETDMVSNVSAANEEVTFTVEAVDVSYVGKTVTIPVVIKMQNYADVEISVVISRSEKDQPVLAVQSIEKTYDGEELTAEDIVGTATFEGEELTGTWEWVTDPATMVNANEAGYTATVEFVPDNSDDFMEVEAELTVVINKADPTGQPSYTKIRSANKTLADAELEVGTITPEGTIAWVDSLDTVVERRAKYQWVFTPNDTTNYNNLTGEIVLYSGSSGGSSRPSSSKDNEREDDVVVDVIDKYYDVNRYDWYAEAVEMVVSAGLFEGVSENRFDPNGTMTRAMLVTVLWRLAGEPEADSASSFSDVSRRAWYADAVAWANENGIVTGINEATFAPDQNITREQMAVILYRYAQTIGLDVSARADLSGYADASGISAYAEEAMSWAVAEGLISGMTETTLAPKGTATRAQVATILMRFVNYVL